MTTFVGRRNVISAAERMFDTSRLVTLTGVGGIGKTRLAQEVRAVVDASFADRTWMVELATLRDDDAVPEAVVTALGLSATGTLGPVAQLTGYVADRHLLLVLDNCEHVLTGCRALVDALLRVAPRLCIMATSREPLGINGERLVSVRPLTVPDPARPIDLSQARSYEALALLEDRARSVNDQFQLDEDNLHDAIEICARLDGLPLAIELAAARLRALSLHQLLERIDNRFAMLTKGDPTALPHHRTLEALVQWSYELCSPQEQTLWNRMSVFAGGSDLDAVAGVCVSEKQDITDLIDVLDGLVSKSILIPDQMHGQSRYRLLETLGDYGRRHVEGTPEQQALRTRHAAYYRRLASDASTGFCSRNQKLWMLRLHADRANLAVALEWMVTTGSENGVAALELAASLRFYWTTGNLREGRRWLDSALDRAQEQGEPRGNALWANAWVAALQGECAQAHRYLDEARKIAIETGSTAMAAHVATWTGTVALFSGELQAARESFEEAAHGHRSHQDLEGLLMTLFQLGITCVLLGDSSHAHAACDEAISRSRECGESWAQSYALWTLAHDAWVRSELTDAVDLAQQSLKMKYVFADHVGTALVLGVLAGAAADSKDFERSARLLGIASATWKSLGTNVSAFGPQLASSYSAVADRTRDHLGDKFEPTFNAGARMSIEDSQRFTLMTAPAEPEPENKPAGGLLTAREGDVAKLLAHGLTNRQIAAKLVLSPRTIEGHVEHILAKLGYSTRAEAAVWAATNFADERRSSSATDTGETRRR